MYSNLVIFFYIKVYWDMIVGSARLRLRQMRPETPALAGLCVFLRPTNLLIDGFFGTRMDWTQDLNHFLFYFNTFI